MNDKLASKSAEETKELAQKISATLELGDTILLTGSLGAGKTTFIQGLAQGLGVECQVQSPTFVIAHEYQGRMKVHHIDLYRIDDSEEFVPFLRELPGDGVLIVEWGEKLGENRPDEYLEILFEFGDLESDRVLELVPVGESWERRAQYLRI